MKHLAGFGVVLLLSGFAFAQGGHGGFGSVGSPGGARATTSHFGGGITGNGFGNVAFPGLATSPGQLVNPNFPSRLGHTMTGGGYYGNGYYGNGYRGRGQSYVYVPYVYPMYEGGYDQSYYDQGAPQQQPNTTIVYPPQAPPVTIINQIPPAAMQSQMVPGQENSGSGAPEQNSANATPDNGVGSYYLIAFKDHTIYSAVAYWVEGDTLHYFTAGNVHNQASMDLVDKGLTERLNKERNIDVRLPQ